MISFCFLILLMYNSFKCLSLEYIDNTVYIVRPISFRSLPYVTHACAGNLSIAPFWDRNNWLRQGRVYLLAPEKCVDNFIGMIVRLVIKNSSLSTRYAPKGTVKDTKSVLTHIYDAMRSLSHTDLMTSKLKRIVIRHSLFQLEITISAHSGVYCTISHQT